MSGEHPIHFSSATVWTGAENVPPIGSRVGGGGGVAQAVTCHIWPFSLSFFILECQHSVQKRSSRPCQLWVTPESEMRCNLFWGGLSRVSLRHAPLIQHFWRLQTLTCNRICDFLPLLRLRLSRSYCTDDWLTVRLRRTLKQSPPPPPPQYNLTLAVSNIPEAAMEDSWFR